MNPTAPPYPVNRRRLPAGTCSALLERARPLLRGGIISVSIASLVGVLVLLNADRENLAFYSLIVGTGCSTLWIWAKHPIHGLPFLPLFIIQQMLIYGLPLARGNVNYSSATAGAVFQCALAVTLMTAFALAGFKLGMSSSVRALPSRWNFSLQLGSTRNDQIWRLAITLLLCALGFQIASRTGLIWKLLPGGLGRFFPVVRTFADAASIIGALTGALYIGQTTRSNRTPVFWVLIAVLFFLSIADVLISAATGLVLATVVGLALGKGRIPWALLIVAMCLVGFLNQGKFVIREKYWGADGQGRGASIQLLPSFYGEWAAASAQMFFGKSDDNLTEAISVREKMDDGQSILDRVDNLNILIYSVEAVTQRAMPVLYGRTYALIPPLLIPRFLWPDKPGAHEGQILLNLHFKRQLTEAQARQTYIAWGLLPESIGNFGPCWGPVLVGFFIGWLFGILEKVSLRKQLFSIEGMLLLSILLKVTISFEMVASIFVTSTFQFLVAVGLGTWVLRRLFVGGSENSRRPRLETAKPPTKS